jgi:hypothetical protein
VIDTKLEGHSVIQIAAEHIVTIGGEIVWYTRFGDYVFKKHSCLLTGINILSDREIDHHICQTVDKV